MLVYIASLDKLYELDIELVLPGHKDIFRNCRERIRELKDLHQKRLDEINRILGRSRKTLFR
jgi:glyoxylase-like metal-dependent hydrolase (beta-lactamase superfamily II)